jgi:ornithine cyclodeaminase/alanine dehydrogenase-like protein (mu-crystallin family)
MADIDWSRVVELKDLDRSWNPKAVTIFKSVGLCVEDVAVAGYVYERLLFG